jgi:hypothetical protein
VPVAQNTARGGGGSAIGVDDRLGEGEGICGVLRRENGGGRGKGCGGIERCLLNGAAEGRGRRVGPGLVPAWRREKDGGGEMGVGGRRGAEHGRAGLLTRAPGATVTSGAVKMV